MGFPKGRGAALPFGRPTGFIPRGGEIKLIMTPTLFNRLIQDYLGHRNIQHTVR